MLPNQALRACFGDGTPRGIRTPDLLLRRQLLYPAELLAHIRASRSAPGLYRMKTQRSGFLFGEGGRRSRMCSFARLFSKNARSGTEQASSDDGAGDGNRTHVSSLEGWCSTIELHPQRALSAFSQKIIPYSKAECQSFF